MNDKCTENGTLIFWKVPKSLYNLPKIEIFILAEMYGLMLKFGPLKTKNNYFADLLKLSNTNNISRAINSLEKKGFLIVEKNGPKRLIMFTENAKALFGGLSLPTRPKKQLQNDIEAPDWFIEYQKNLEAEV